MLLTSKYVQSPPLQFLFRDKLTALPLIDGYVLFFSDTNRTVGKEIFQIAGTPPAYNVVPYGSFDLNGAWRVDLTAAGALQFNPILYPYDTNGDVELYFIQVYNNQDVFQYSLEGWPLGVESIPTGTPVEFNFAPNGQFLLHTDIPATASTTAGQVTTAITEIAYGGWTFERPSGSTATDFITFQQFLPTAPNYAASPRYALEVKCTAADGSDTFKDVRLKFLDVNKFASTTQQYTFAFTASSLGIGSVPATIRLIKNFGTGGSPQTDTLLDTISITTGTAVYDVSFIFGDNTAKTIGTLNDDYIQLVIRLPTSGSSDTLISDVILAEGAVLTPLFPPTTDAQFLYQSIAGQLQIPPYDGSKIGLPLVLSRSGIVYDDGSVGSIFARCNYETIPFYLQLCDGSTFKTTDYTADGIPRSRLQAELFDTTLNYPIYGTGSSFVTATPLVGATDTFRLSTNKNGSVPSPANGTASPGFTFTTIVDGSSVLWEENSAWIETGQTGVDKTVWIIDLRAGALTVVPSTDTGWTVYWETDYRDNAAPSLRINSYPVTLVAIDTSAAGIAGQYFLYEVVTGNTILVWFRVNGVGVMPVVGHTIDIRIDVLSTFTKEDLQGAIMEALNAYASFTVQCVGGGSITAGDYWEFETLTDEYYVWYKVDGVGVDPVPVNKIAIEVDILSADTAAQVCTKTTTAINSTYYAVPNALGLHLRGRDVGTTNNTIPLLSQYAPLYSAVIGYYQHDIVGSHIHDDPNSPTDFIVNKAGANAAAGAAFIDQAAYANTSFPENTVRSLQVYWVIHI